MICNKEAMHKYLNAAEDHYYHAAWVANHIGSVVLIAKDTTAGWESVPKEDLVIEKIHFTMAHLHRNSCFPIGLCGGG